MRKLYYLFVAGLVLCGISACKKGGSGNGNSVSPNASMLILGKWNLQQQKTVIYVNGSAQIDTTYLTSLTNVSRAKFNKDNTFNSVGLRTTVITDGNLNNTNSASLGVDSTSGTYAIVNSSLNINVELAGFSNMVGFYDAASSVGTVSLVNVVSRSSKIMLLTSSKFNLHYELVYNTLHNNVITNYKEELDYYYTR